MKNNSFSNIKKIFIFKKWLFKQPSIMYHMDHLPKLLILLFVRAKIKEYYMLKIVTIQIITHTIHYFTCFYIADFLLLDIIAFVFGIYYIYYGIITKIMWKKIITMLIGYYIITFHYKTIKNNIKSF